MTRTRPRACAFLTLIHYSISITVHAPHPSTALMPILLCAARAGVSNTGWLVEKRAKLQWFLCSRSEQTVLRASTTDLLECLSCGICLRVLTGVACSRPAVAAASVQESEVTSISCPVSSLARSAQPAASRAPLPSCPPSPAHQVAAFCAQWLSSLRGAALGAQRTCGWTRGCRAGHRVPRTNGRYPCDQGFCSPSFSAP